MPTYTVKLPPEITTQVDQYSERFILVEDGQEREITLHDYTAVYAVPGLYQTVVTDILQCFSYRVVPELLAQTLAQAGANLAALTVLDVGAGIGLVGAELKQHGAQTLIGLDIVPAARTAAERDHPGLYQAYLVDDACQPTAATQAQLAQLRPNCMVCVSAIGLGGAHVTPDIFACFFNLMPADSWVAFNLSETFFGPDDTTGYNALIERLVYELRLEIHLEHRYQHRVLTDGTPIYYKALVGIKRG